MTDLDRYKAKLTRLLKHKDEEPNNTYHDWDAEIQRCKNNIADEVMEESTDQENTKIKTAYSLLEEAAEEIENLYGRETELSEKIRALIV